MLGYLPRREHGPWRWVRNLSVLIVLALASVAEGAPEPVHEAPTCLLVSAAPTARHVTRRKELQRRAESPASSFRLVWSPISLHGSASLLGGLSLNP